VDVIDVYTYTNDVSYKYTLLFSPLSFAIVPIGSSNGDEDKNSNQATGFKNMDRNYKQALLDELRIIQKASNKKIHLQSIYFGGGTPSLAPLSTLQEVMHAIYKSQDAPFHIDDDESNVEITIEMDPGTFDETYLESIKQMGFNRISLGVQSFDDNILSNLGRVHRSVDVYNSIKIIGKVFGEENANYSLDLISGIPGLSLAGWSETLYKAVSLNPKANHMSVYDLQVEKATTFGKWYSSSIDTDDEEGSTQPQQDMLNSTSHHPSLPTPDDCAFMYSYASGYLRSRGYEHYEISSYAAYKSSNKQADSYRSQHNQIYWKPNGQWYSIGLGATSNVNGVRYARPRALSDYIKWIEGLMTQNTNKPPWLHRNEEDEEDDELLDIVMTRLRTIEGLDLDWTAKHYTTSHVHAIQRGFNLAIDLDLGISDNSPDKKYGSIRLKDPKGFLFSNNIISNIFLELSEMND